MIFQAEPWSSYCVEPPCGQLNPTKEDLYNHLEDIYSDMAGKLNFELSFLGFVTSFMIPGST